LTSLREEAEAFVESVRLGGNLAPKKPFANVRFWPKADTRE